MNTDAILYITVAMLNAAQLTLSLTDADKWFEPKALFCWRGAVAILSAGALAWKAYRSKPKPPAGPDLTPSTP